MIFSFAGAISGGIVGWLLGGLHDLRQCQKKQQLEMTWLRKRLTEHLRDEPGESEPDSYTQPESARAVEPEYAAWSAPQSSEWLEDQIPAPDVSAATFAADPEPEFQISQHQERATEPSAIEEWLLTLLSGENLLVKVGVVILFFGVSFLVKYAAQRGLFPIELRLTAAALSGCALLATGWRLRAKRPVYAQVIQGGSVGILYLTTYAALHLYHLLPTGLGFALLVAICALSAVLAVVQESRSLAVMGSAGGLLAPELAGIGSNSPAMLFGYYAILNGGILAIARQRAWRELDLLGFAGTFIVSAEWGSRFYSPEYFFTVEPFLVLFFLIYAVLPILHAQRQTTMLDGPIDCTLVFGTPILAFAFQSALVRQYEYGLAWSALAAGIFYVTLAGRLLRDEPGRMRSLAEAFLALGTVFGTLAIPLAFEGRWTSAAWGIEGAALVWVGLRQERRLARVFGYLLLIGSGIIFLADGGLRSGIWPILNSSYIGCLLVSGAALFSARQLARNRQCRAEYERFAEPLLFAWGMLWWFGGGLREVGEHTLNDLTFGATLVFVASSCLACNLLRKRLDWRLLEWPAFALLPAMSILALLHFLGDTSYPSFQGGWFGWPLALAAWYLILHNTRQRQPRLPMIVHAPPFWLMTLLAAWELSGRIHHHLPGMETWGMCAWGVVPALAVLLIGRRGSGLPWPVEGNLAAYLGLGSAPLASAAGLWLLCANLTQAGNPWPLPYLPLLNPLDGATLLVLLSLVCWYRAIRGSLPDLAQMLPQREAVIALAATIFVWLNAILLRSIHHWCGVSFTARALFASLTVQTTLSICWSLLALTLMTLATRSGVRRIWLAGAGLLGAVVAKLFLVDLAGHGSVARIVSFVVVGLLILLIGWFSPVPPRATEGGAS
jgi:uncharacterized membrane protein